MKNLIIIIIILVISSCANREVQLPETKNNDILNPTDVSPIYIFFDEESGRSEFNRNNMIGTTNWLVNVDKRLKLESVVPHLISLYDKRKSDGMHKNENARNYFSCSNPEIQNLAFIDFTGVAYHKEPIAEFMKTKQKDTTKIEVFVNVRHADSVMIGKRFAIKQSNLENLLTDLVDSASKDSLTNLVYMNYRSRMSFQEYIDFKSKLLENNSSRIEISLDEFIYN